MTELNIYSGELKDGMPCRKQVGCDVVRYEWHRLLNIPDEIYVLNKETGEGEWQLYKPQAKKVWGIPEIGSPFYLIHQYVNNFARKEIAAANQVYKTPVWLSKEHAEQHAKALNMANEFRLLSDVPVDGVEQWSVNVNGNIYEWNSLVYKLENSIFGVVFNTRQQAKQALAKFPQIHIANKIIQFGFHGIVEEKL